MFGHREAETRAIVQIATRVETLVQRLDALTEAVASLTVTRTAPAPPPSPAPDEPPNMRAVYAAIAQIAPEEGPMRRHLLRTAEQLLMDPNQTPESVAELITRGSDDDGD